MRRLWVGVAASVLCAVSSSGMAQTPARPAFGAFGVDLDARDLRVRPGDDFWTYANGAWSARTPLPSDLDAIGTGPQASRNAEQQVRAVLEALAANNGGPSDDQRLGDLYASWLNEANVERAGLAPAKPYLAQIERARDASDVQALMAMPGFGGPIAFDVYPDPADRTRNLAYISQGGLGLGAEYLLDPGDRFVAYRQAYGDYVRDILQDAGFKNAQARAQAIVALEIEIAKSQWSRADSRDESRLKILNLTALSTQAPQLNWALLLRSAGLEGGAFVAVSQDTALTALGSIIAQKPMPLWRDYLAFRFLNDHADYLPKAFSDRKAKFYAATLSGVSVQAPRWKRGVVLMNDQIGDAVGAAYAKRYLSTDTVAQVQAMVEDVRQAFAQRIVQSTWMDAQTKQGALEKIATMRANVGALSPAPDYSGLRIDRDDLLGNVMRLTQYRRARDGRRLAAPNLTFDYPMSPQLANGFYYAPGNSITLQAALLQPPFFDAAADPAVNYGALGAFIGHEMGHAFDDQGSRYDSLGQLRDWWSPASRQAFERKSAVLKAQFDAYEILPGVKVNGALTLGENIADLGGLEAAYAAFQRYQTRHGTAPVIDGLTGDQRFFLANAQMRRVKLRDDVARQLATFDTHAPSLLRVNATLRNIDAWYAAFAVQASDTLYLPQEQRVGIW